MLKIVDHAIVQKNLTQIRDKNIDRVHFRQGIIEIGKLMGYEYANTLEKEPVTVNTPLGVAKGIKIKDMENIMVVIILRLQFRWLREYPMCSKRQNMGLSALGEVKNHHLIQK